MRVGHLAGLSRSVPRIPVTGANALFTQLQEGKRDGVI